MKFQFFLRVSNDISASIPSIEEFILQVLLLGDDSEAQTLRKVRRTLQSQPRAVNQILANVLDKGDLWTHPTYSSNLRFPIRNLHVSR